MAFDISRHWYRNDLVSFALWPISWLYCGIAQLRRRWLVRRAGHLSKRLPVIIVGNITVGGTGKTPMVIWLCRFLHQQGLRPGVISRGYGGSNVEPRHVVPESAAEIVGDEAIVIARQSGVPVWVGHRRVEVAEALLNNHRVDVIVADDGMQHYHLPRDIEIAMIDGNRRFGNELCLPAGPLREPMHRLAEVDYQVVSGGAPQAGEFATRVVADRVVNLLDHRMQTTLEQWKDSHVHAVAGLGNPQRFFDLLQAAGVDFTPHIFPDHYQYRVADLQFGNLDRVIMTEKDAVKCREFAEKRFWYLSIYAEPDAAFSQQLAAQVKRLTNGQ